MERESHKFMTPFDCLTTPHWLYMMKLMLPYTPDSLQQTLAVFIRFQEMQYTMKHFRGFFRKRNSNTVLSDIKPYMEPSEQEMMEQMESMMNMMEMMQMMQGASSDDSSGFNPLDMFSGMMGSDLSDLFNMKGDTNNE